MTPDQLTDDQKELIRGMAHPASNIAALHFDGAKLDEWLRTAVEIELKYVGNRPWRWRD